MQAVCSHLLNLWAPTGDGAATSPRPVGYRPAYPFGIPSQAAESSDTRNGFRPWKWGRLAC